MQSDVTNPETNGYLTTKEDENENFLSGSKNYRLHLPKNVRASYLWSVVLYD